LIVPFSVLSENRKEEFAEEMEKAAIYCYAELERKKGGGLILRKPEEKPVFLAEFYYPLLLVPWGNLDLILDGLKTTTYTLAYRSIPDVKTFLKTAQRSSKTLEVYMPFLTDNTSYFQIPKDEKTKSIDALVTEQSFLDELGIYVSEAKQFEVSPSKTVFLPTAIDESGISSLTQELENLKHEFRENVDVLYESMAFLKKTARDFSRMIRSKIKAIVDEFGEAIRNQEAAMAPTVDRINEEYDQQIAKLSNDFEKQRLPLQKDKIKLEKTKEQTLAKIERYNLEAKTSAANKDAVGETKWKEKTSEAKKEFSEIENKIEEIEAKIKELENAKSLEAFKVKSEWETKVKEAKKDLLELESSRDAKIQMHTQEIEKLESLTLTIIQHADTIAKMEEANLANLQKLGIPQKHVTPTLIYVPFYLACYQAERKRRYAIFSPSVVNSIGFTTKLKGALGKAKVKQLLVPRFKTITAFLTKFSALIERDAVFEREIREAGGKVDLLKTSFMRERVENGLKRLKEEGWLSEKENKVFAEAHSKTYA
jgi:DNA repair exonuclease SbcCD ATPase subunit